jgi:hypothetical protein
MAVSGTNEKLQERVMASIQRLATGLMVLLLATCGSKALSQTGDGGGSPGKGKKPFLDATFDVPSGKEWNKDVIARKGGTISFRVTSQGPFAVTVVTDKGRKALMSGGKVDKADILLTENSKEAMFEGKVTLPAGKSWFIIENQTKKSAKIRLECTAE